MDKMEGRAYCGGVAPEPLPPFLVLVSFFSSRDGRKEAKEDQGLTEAEEVWPGI